MNARTHVFTFTLIIALLFVPALTRVHQRLEHRSAGTLNTACSRSAETPPERLLAAPPLTLGVLVVSDGEKTRPPAGNHPPAADEPVASRALASPDALRAPPRA